MRVFRIVAIMALLTAPAYAQTLIQSFESKTPQQKADEALKEKSAREAAKQAPETAPPPSVDAWGNVRSTDAAKPPAPKKSKTATVTAGAASANVAVSFVAGVPPDYFSEDGQLWGTPLYAWNALAREGYRWRDIRISAPVGTTIGMIAVMIVGVTGSIAAFKACPSSTTFSASANVSRLPSMRVE